ncbi:MAG: EAL domain-containing protein, partial [Pseudomonadota bacterium]
HDMGYYDLRVAVNVSGRQIEDRQFPEIVRETLELYALDAERLELELTESVMLEAAADELGIIEHLREIGVSISIDDFGTGYSSFRYLQEFPVQCLKIDRSLVATFDADVNQDRGRSGLAIARAIVTLGEGLCIRIVAEGIETHDQFDAVRQLGCDEIQGFLFSKPVPFSETTLMLKNGVDLTSV